ncbi:hypothetical protein FO519_009440 [Halicephalobus sp. NKZ332]|nr:hypothetical protein FO519_009440 [Halicephalobus sp. NKZ332]
MAHRVFVVTGSNQGIGYGIVEKLAQVLDSPIIYLTARDTERGKTALSKLNDTLGSKNKSDIRFHQLDITKENSVKEFAEFLKKEHNGLDVLINNAGFAFKNDATEPASVQADVTIGVNYYGTKLVSSHLIPLIRTGGRIVNVCSQMGVMQGKYDQKHIDKLKNATDESDIDEFVEEYKKRSKEPDTRKEGGFPESAYRVSKAAEIALTMLYHRRYKDLKINACCPGYVSTNMTSYKGHLPVEQGADTPVYLATSGEAPSGEFVYQRKVIEW